MASFIAGFTNSALVTFGLAFCLTVVLEVRASLLDPSLISHELRSFANNALGVEELQVSKTVHVRFTGNVFQSFIVTMAIQITDLLVRFIVFADV